MGDAAQLGRPPTPPTVLIVEDDESLRALLVRGLSRHGFGTLEAGNGEQALQMFAATAADVVLLDLGLPGMDGLTVLTRLRAVSDVPVVVLSGRDDEADRVLGLELGADDYVVKPYSLRELVARLRARLRRPHAVADPPGLGIGTLDSLPGAGLTFGDVRLDPVAREVFVAGELIELTAREYELLAFLAAHPRQVFTRTQLLERVWGTRFQDPATVTEHVRRVRAKVEGRPAKRHLITTLRGLGYRFDPGGEIEGPAR